MYSEQSKIPTSDVIHSSKPTSFITELIAVAVWSLTSSRVWSETQADHLLCQSYVHVLLSLMISVSMDIGTPDPVAV